MSPAGGYRGSLSRGAASPTRRRDELVEQDFWQENFRPPVGGPTDITTGSDRATVVTITHKGLTHQSVSRLPEDV
jgi:hypothetical protein